jgi:hypothetical protein
MTRLEATAATYRLYLERMTTAEVVAYAHAKLTEVTARRAFEARTRDAPRDAVLTTASFALAMAELEERDARELRERQERPTVPVPRERSASRRRQRCPHDRRRDVPADRRSRTTAITRCSEGSSTSPPPSPFLNP